MKNKASQKYLKQVQHFLVCSRADQKRLLIRCKELVDSFQQENPEAEYAELVNAFGEPAACATELLSSLGDTKIEATQRKRRWLYRAAIAVALVAVAASVFTASFWYIKYCRQQEFEDEFIFVIEPPVEGTLEEFIAAKEREAQLNGYKS